MSLNAMKKIAAIALLSGAGGLFGSASAHVVREYQVAPAGAGYKRHRDRFQGSNSRVLSLVTYLNDDWQDADGGALRLYLPEGTVDVLPQACMSVCFLSETEHEVLPAKRERLSIAAWLRTS